MLMLIFVFVVVIPILSHLFLMAWSVVDTLNDIKKD